MSLKDRLVAAGIAPEHAPCGFQVLGDVLLAKFPQTKIAAKEKRNVAKVVAQILPNVRAVAEIKRISGELRKPKITLLFSKKGKSLETVHIEHGIKFKLDPRKVMFSKGNLAERARLASKIRPDEIIIDMFAGIGYFSLGIAKHEKSAEVISVEKNPVAFRYLKENIKLNKIRNIRAIRGDCRTVRMRQKADRVIMGYFVSNAERSHKARVRSSEQRSLPGTEKYLKSAFRLLKPHAVIHYHNIYSEKDAQTKPVAELEAEAKTAGYRIIRIAHRVVKSYAPHVLHVVVDAEVEHVGAKGFYNKTADMYDLRQKNEWTARLREAELDLIRAHARGNILDIGCGTGFHLTWLERNSDETISLTGIDVSKEMLETARTSASTAKFVEGNAEHLPYADNSFDTILCMFSTLNLCDYRAALAEIKRVLKPNGKLILSVSSIWDNDGKSEKKIRIEKEVLRLHLFTASELGTEFERAGLTIVKFDSLFRSSRPRWGDWSSAVTEDLKQPVERGAMYLYVLEKNAL